MRFKPFLNLGTFWWRQPVNNARNFNCIERTITKNFCTDNFKLLEENPISLYNIKKIIKGTGKESHEGPTCLKTECPVCEMNQQSPNKDGEEKLAVFINKTTGMDFCS